MKLRILALCLIALLCIPLCLPTAAAPAPKKLLVLGDSISTGFGLTPDANGYVSSYANQLAEHYGLQGDAYRNSAVNGATSSDLLTKLPVIVEQVKAADTIVISIGGNDLLGKMLSMLQLLSGSVSVDSAVNALQTADPAMFNAVFMSPEMRAEYDKSIVQFGKNMVKIVNLLKEQNPNAQVVFLTQYDPLSGAEQFSTMETTKSIYSPLAELAQLIITGLNTQMKNAVEGQKNFSLCDVYTEMLNKGGELTLIYQFDIHPNQAGHDLIFSMVRDHIAALGASAETTGAPITTQAPVTTAAPVTTQAPVTTAAPITTQAPATTAAPTTTAASVTTQAPVTTAPTTTAAPAATQAPITTEAPVTTAPAAATTTPDTPPAPETTATVIDTDTSDATPSTTAIERLPLDDTTTGPILIILGIALFSIAFGLIRMIIKKKS